MGEVLGSLEPVDVGLWVNSSRPAGHIAIMNVVMELVVALWQIKRWSYYTGQRWCFTIKVEVLHWAEVVFHYKGGVITLGRGGVSL